MLKPASVFTIGDYFECEGEFLSEHQTTLRICSMAALFAFGGGLMVSAQPYSFTTVDFPAANVTYVDSINNFGQRAGYFIDANGPHGFVATRQHFKTIDPPYGPLDNPYAGIAINDFGVAVGKASVTAPNSLIIGGHWIPGGVWEFHEDQCSQRRRHTAFGDQQLRTDHRLFTDRAGTHGFLETNGVYRTIQNPSATGASIPFSINNAGQIVGWFDQGSATHGFLYQNGVFTSIEDPLGPYASRPALMIGVRSLDSIIDAAGFHGLWKRMGLHHA